MNPPLTFIDRDAYAKAQALVTSYAATSQPANPPELYPGDTLPWGFVFLRLAVQGATSSPYPYFIQDPSGWSNVTIEAGAIGQTPDGGSYTLSGTAGGTTAPIAFDATAGTVQTRIRTLTSLGAATVTGNAGGPYSVDSGSTASPTLDLSDDSAALAPDGSRSAIVKTQVADGSLNNRWVITLVRAFLLYNDSWSPLDSPLVTDTTEQAGNESPPLSSKVKRIRWNSDALGGAVTLSLTDDGGETSSVGPIPFDADAPTFSSFFTDQTVISVTKNNAGDYTVRFTGAFANNTTVDLEPDTNTLEVPLGLQAPIVVSVAGALALFASESSTTTQIDVTLTIRVTESAGQPATVVQMPATLFRTFPVDGGPATGQPAYLNTHTGITFLKAITGYTGGGSTNLDGLSTTAYNTLDLVEMIHTVDGAGQFQFTNPNATATATGLVIEPLDNSAARWIRKL